MKKILRNHLKFFRHHTLAFPCHTPGRRKFIGRSFLPAHVLVILFFASAHAQQKTVCFTIDDLPVVAYGHSDSAAQKEIMYKLVASLVRNAIPAIGFVNETKLYREGQLLRYQYAMLEHWTANGMALGNHTFSHMDYNLVPATVFFTDVVKGETRTRQILSRHNRPLTWFRHPYLHTGSTKFKSDSLREFLSRKGYREAPVTIDNDDYLFALAYSREKSAGVRAQIGTDYIVYMERKLRYFERASEFLFGRKIPQILLLHASQLNADYLDALAAMFTKADYRFAALEETVDDPAYQTPVTVFNKFGISWIERWILSSTKSRDVLAADPTVPEYIRKLTE